MAMNERSELILQCIVEQYIETAEPIGSRLLSKLPQLNLSAATIRNVMSDLSEFGLITQPHTSSGRIPTDKGYRYYINNLLRNRKQDKNYSEEEDHCKIDSSQGQLEDILRQVTAELSHMTKYTGITVSPQPMYSRLRKVELIQLSRTKVLIVLITQIGVVKNKIIYVRNCPEQEYLNRLSRILTDKFQGEKLNRIQDILIETLSDGKADYDEYLAQAIRIGKKAFDYDIPGDLFISGRSNILNLPEFCDQENLRDMYQLFEDKKVLLKAFEETINIQGINIKIGNENSCKGLNRCSIVSATYGSKEYLLGTLGVIGPTRMDYSKIISAIDYSAQKLSIAVKQFLNDF